MGVGHITQIKMWKLPFLSLVITFAVAVATKSASKGPQFIIGETAKRFFSMHHVDNGVAQNQYRAYVRENSKELFVEPPIQVTFKEDHPTKDDDVCEYKIVPTVGKTEEKEGASKKRNPDYEDDEEDYDDDDNRLPFSIRPSKESPREAVLEVNGNLNCEHRGTYQFDIVAVSCSGGVSESATVNVTVEDVNEFTPKFSKTLYEAEIQEDRLPGVITRVEAFDEDCSEQYNKISRYEISEPANAPFRIDESGNVYSTRVFNHSQEKQFTLSLVAYDADGKKSSYPSTLLVRIKPACQAHWTGLDPSIDFTGDASATPLFPKAQLNLCEIPQCQKVEKISGHVTLQNNHIGKGCDREERLPLAVQHRRCSSKIRPNTAIIELLSPDKDLAPQAPKVDGNETNRRVFAFDGVKSAIVVGTDKLSPETFNRSFTITTWLKRDAPTNKTHDHKYPKEHILCISDDHERSRHHVALYVRNCRLGLLLRREPRDGESLTVFRPAEWRWNLNEQLCNNQWHHYAISVKYPDVKLFIDGKEFVNDAETEIIDDWALHPIKGIQTTSVIGACWQGAQRKMDQYFRGYLDSLSVLVNATEEESVLDCMQRCSERLTVPESNAVTKSPEQSIYSMLDDDENELLIEGHSVESFQYIVRRVSYENTRLYPTPGLRFAHLKTSITCTSNTNEKITKELPPIKVELNVQEAAAPTVTISGPTALTIDAMDKAQNELTTNGAKILDSLTISVMRSGSPTADNPDYESLVKRISRDEVVLDSCTVSLKQNDQDMPPKLAISSELLSTHRMTISESAQQFGETYWMIQGAGNEIPDYLAVLRDARLVLVPGRGLDGEKHYKVSVICRDMATKTFSAKYTFQVTLKDLQPVHKQEPVLVPVVHTQPRAHIMDSSHHIAVANPILSPAGNSHDFSDIYGPHSVFSFPQFHSSETGSKMSSAGAAVTVVVIVCISFFIFLVFVSVVKIRQVHNMANEGPANEDGVVKKRKASLKNSLKSIRKKLAVPPRRMSSLDEEDDLERGTELKKGDMAWDDAGMSIHVNPLQAMQTGCSDCEYDYEEDDQECEEDAHCNNHFGDEDEMSEEEKENEEGQQQFGYQFGHEDNDSADECDECSTPNREKLAVDVAVRRSQSYNENFAKATDSRMTKSELEWDDQI